MTDYRSFRPSCTFSPLPLFKLFDSCNGLKGVSFVSIIKRDPNWNVTTTDVSAEKVDCTVAGFETTFISRCKVQLRWLFSCLNRVFSTECWFVPDMPTPAAAKVLVTQVTPSSVDLAWDDFKLPSYDAGYVVQHRPLPGSDHNWEQEQVNTPHLQTSFSNFYLIQEFTLPYL